jgi:tRNA(Ile)-lysidine synthase
MSELSPAFLLEQLQLHHDSHIVLALSGGLDSMVLLELLCQARQLQEFSLQAVYIHHGISAFASQWGDFCRAQCKMRHVSFSLRQVELGGRDNLELRAREARYHALAKFVCSDKHILLTAHHGDDQFESLLLALKRGSGVAGLSGIAARRDFSTGSLQRPLLAFSRAELQSYAQQRQLSWVEDDSNDDTRFDRNFIRQQISPLLRQRWPHFSRAVGRSVQHLAQLQQLADHYTDLALTQCLSGSCLMLSELHKLLPLQQDLVIRRWLGNYGLNPEALWLNTLKQQVIAARIDAVPSLQLGDYQIRRFADKLYLLSRLDVIQPTQALKWQAEAEVELPAQCGRLYFTRQAEQDAIPVNVTAANIVFGQLSLRFTPHGATMSKPLKQWFKLWQVPPWQRLRVPLLLVDGQLVAVAGYASSVAAQRAQYWLSWQR